MRKLYLSKMRCRGGFEETGGRQRTVPCLPPVSLVCWEKVKNKRNAPEKDVPFCAFVVF